MLPCSVIGSSAERLNLPSVIPGRGNVATALWSLDQQTLPSNISLHDVSVVAGHFDWDVWSKLPSLTTSHDMTNDQISTASVANSGEPRACFIMHRHPVSRVISYFYRRVFSESVDYYNRKLNTWPVDELRDIIRLIRHPTQLLNGSYVLSDEGMSNAACRTLSATRLTTGSLYHEDAVIPNEPEFDHIAMQTALRNSGQCVAGIQEDMRNTMRVLKFWFPWINTTNYPNFSNIKNQGHNRDMAEDISELRSDIRAVIEDENQCDMSLYQAAQSQFFRQLEILDSNEFISK